MKFLENVLALITTLAIIILAAWLAYWGIRYIIDQFQIVNPSTSATLTILAVIVIISSIIISGAIRSVVKSGDKPIHPEKAIIYKQFIDIWCNTGFPIDQNLKMSNARAMALWAGDGVLKQYLILKKIKPESRSNEQVSLAQIEKVIMEMRKDLGQKNFGVRSGNINEILNQGQLSDNKTS